MEQIFRPPRAAWSRVVVIGIAFIPLACSEQNPVSPLAAPARPVAAEPTPPLQLPLPSPEGREPAEPVAEEPEVAAPLPGKPQEEVVPRVSSADLDSLPLSAIPDFAPLAGCSRERFAELEGLASTLVYPRAGAAGNRARTALVEAGKEAFPAILNELKRLNLMFEEEFRSADVCQRTLTEICSGRNFGWYYPSQQPDDYCQRDEKIIRAWCKLWLKAEQNEDFWKVLTKQKSQAKRSGLENEDQEDAETEEG